MHRFTPRRPIPTLLGLLLGLVLVQGCATTTLVETWQAPGLEPADLEFEDVVAIAVMPDETRQRLVEDALAAAATHTKVTPAYTILEPEDRDDPARLRAALERNGIDGAVTVTLVDTEKQQTYVPGTTRVYPGGYYGYYRAVGAVVYEPGYTHTDTIVVVETSLYNVSEGKLLWSGISRTMNPKNVDSLIEGIVEAARDELHSEGLLP
jgi:hypothetical protein